jgi:hypothetical protein
MYLDNFGDLSTAQAETTATTHISDNVVDLGVSGRRIVDPLWYFFRVTTAIVSAGGGTLQIQIVTSAAAALTASTVIWDSGTIPNATIVAWAVNAMPYPRIPVTYADTLLRYFGAIYTIGTDVFTAGAWDLRPAVDVSVPAL